MKKLKNKIDKTDLSVYILISISLLSKFLGFIRDGVLAGVYGTSYMADVFVFALSIPDFFFDMLNNTVIIGFIPIMSSFISKKDFKTANSFFNSTLKWAVFSSGFISLIVLLFSGYISTLLAPGFNSFAHELSSNFISIIIISLVFKSVVSVFSGFLNINSVFYPPAWTGIIFDILVIISIFLSLFTSSYILPFFVLISSIIQTLFLLYYVKKQTVSFDFTASMLSHENISMLKNVLPALLAVGVLQISTIVNRAISTNILEGGIAYINYSSKMSFFAENIIVASVCTVLYPRLTVSFAEYDFKSFSVQLTTAIKKIILFLLPTTFFLYIFSEPLIDILFKRGSFTNEDVIITANMMKLNVIGILFIGLYAVLTRALYALRRIKIVMIFSLFMLFLNIVFSLVLSGYFDLYGIALSTSISYFIGSIIYIIIVFKILKNISFKGISLYLFKTCICTISASIILVLIKNMLSDYSIFLYLPFSFLISFSIFLYIAKKINVIH